MTDSSLTLKKITDVWQNAALLSETTGFGIPLGEAVFNLALDKNGRAFFFFTNRKGVRLSLEAIRTENTPLGMAIARIRRQQESLLSWEEADNSVIYLDQNAEFTYQLFKGERVFLYKKKLLSLAQETERAKLYLFVTPKSEETADFQTQQFDLKLKLKTESEFLKNPVPLTATYAICGTQIYKTRDMGINYQFLTRFADTVEGSSLEEYLSLFASIFPSVEITIPGWNALTHAAAQAEPALHFRGLDEEGNLAVKLLWSYEPASTEFISQNKPAALIRLNAETHSISKIPLLYNGAERWLKIQTMLKSCLSRHPECKDEGSDGYTVEGDSLYITAELALPFLSENLGELAHGFRLFGTESLKKYKLRKTTPKTHLSVGSGIDFFDTKCTVEIDGEMLSPAQFVSLYEENQFIPLSDGTRAIIDRSFFLRLKRLLGKQQKDGTYKISFFDLPLIDALINAKIENAPASQWRNFFSGFNSIQTLPLMELPVTQKLRDYQRYGVQWLSYLTQNKLGACLADDMGLGKTIQTIALLAAAYADSHRSTSLIIVPKSLIDNWQSELRTFAGDLDVYAYYGTERNIQEAMLHRIVLTTYAVARNDIETLQKEHFEYIVLDEVQQIKNTSSQSSKAVMLLNAEHRIALSGTPMENNLGELYSIFRFLNPAMFGTEAEFNRRYGIPIQKEGDEDAARELGAKIRPFILRRLKQEVAKELPERTEQVLYVDMSAEQAALYEQQRTFYQQLIQGEIAKNGFEKSQFCILQGLTELRQIATVPEAKTDGKIEGAKWATLTETITELAESGHRCLVFSNFLASIDAMSDRLSAANIPHLVMTGASSNRAELVRKFQQDSTYKVFLMTLKTGGVGLNLTGADYVFILDPWWNRSAEQQAIDRTHRIGQTRSVFCYRLIARDTIEEKILELQKKKSDLFSAVISSDGQQIKKLTEEDIHYLLKD